MNNKFVYSLIPGGTQKVHVIDHPVKDTIGTYCGIPQQDIENRVYTTSLKVTPETPVFEYCQECVQENKKRLAEHYKIKGWVK